MSASETVKLHFKPKFRPTSVNRADWPFYFLYQQFYPLPSVQCGCQSCSEHPWLCRGLHIAISSGLPSFKQGAWRRNMIWDQNLHRTIVMQSCAKFTWENKALQKLFGRSIKYIYRCLTFHKFKGNKKCKALYKRSPGVLDSFSLFGKMRNTWKSIKRQDMNNYSDTETRALSPWTILPTNVPMWKW